MAEARGRQLQRLVGRRALLLRFDGDAEAKFLFRARELQRPGSGLASDGSPAQIGRFANRQTLKTGGALRCGSMTHVAVAIPDPAFPPQDEKAGRFENVDRE